MTCVTRIWHAKLEICSTMRVHKTAGIFTTQHHKETQKRERKNIFDIDFTHTNSAWNPEKVPRSAHGSVTDRSRTNTMQRRLRLSFPGVIGRSAGRVTISWYKSCAVLCQPFNQGFVCVVSPAAAKGPLCYANHCRPVKPYWCTQTIATGQNCTDQQKLTNRTRSVLDQQNGNSATRLVQPSPTKFWVGSPGLVVQTATLVWQHQSGLHLRHSARSIPLAWICSSSSNGPCSCAGVIQFHLSGSEYWSACSSAGLVPLVQLWESSSVWSRWSSSSCRSGSTSTVLLVRSLTQPDQHNWI